MHGDVLHWVQLQGRDPFGEGMRTEADVGLIWQMLISVFFVSNGVAGGDEKTFFNDEFEFREARIICGNKEAGSGLTDGFGDLTA